MLTDSSHMVVVQSGGRVRLVYDFEDETGENELISYTFVSVFRGIEDIGFEFDFELGMESEEYTLVSIKDPSARRESSDESEAESDDSNEGVVEIIECIVVQ